MRSINTTLLVITACISLVAGESIAQINGVRYRSPFDRRNVTNVRGLVTAKGREGFYMRSPYPDQDARTSESIYVHGSYSRNNSNVQVSNVIILDGRVVEYRAQPEYLYLTELDRARRIRLVSRQQPVLPVILGQTGLSPPTEQYTSLDRGNVFGLPNNISSLSRSNPILDSKSYGLDFWESLTGELVTVRQPHAISKANKYGDTWVVGNWQTSGTEDGRGGLTVRDRDGNPEGILIGSPLDGTDNPRSTKLGDRFEDITGIVTYEYGYYRILPLTALRVVSSLQPTEPPPTTLVSTGQCSNVTVGSYNVENLSPNSTNLDAIARHIVQYLRLPELILVQEIQDNDGAADNGTVNANETLSALVDAIRAHQPATASRPVSYSYIDINPVKDRDGGQRGANIRVAYLYNPAALRLIRPNPGSALDANQVLSGPTLRYNPGRIDPRNNAWRDARTPLAAAWEMLSSDGKSRAPSTRPLFTVNVHFTSKGGSTTLHGDARPPVNGGVDQRTAQARVVGNFISATLDSDSDAAVLAAGDFNDFAFVAPLRETFASATRNRMRDLDQVVALPLPQRYTYVHEMNAQQLDHIYVSDGVARRGVAMDHIHLSSWVSEQDEVSDHDPTVASINLCA